MKKITVFLLLLSISTIGFAQIVAISGIVTDEQGNPVPFAFIKDAQHNYATFSDPNGAFTIIADPASALMATRNNFKESVIKIDNQPRVKIVMKAGGTVGSANGSTDLFKVHETGGTDRMARPLAKFGTAQDELHGSPYLFSDWVHGYAVTPADSIRENDSYLFNYEKTKGALLYTDDGKNMYMVDKDQVKAFTLFDNSGQQVTFENVPAIDPKHYLQVLSSGKKYKIYKSLNTKFLRADFQTNGITSSGNNYDSYVDEGIYYAYNVQTKQFKEFKLKKKSIKTVFPDEAKNLDSFFDTHAGDIDDAYLKTLGDFVNQ